jgi:hypothetical protein
MNEPNTVYLSTALIKLPWFSAHPGFWPGWWLDIFSHMLPYSLPGVHHVGALSFSEPSSTADVRVCCITVGVWDRAAEVVLCQKKLPRDEQTYNFMYVVYSDGSLSWSRLSVPAT